MLMTEHNLSFYQQLMGSLRQAIGAQQLAAFAATFRDRYQNPV
jgi:queuine tRNA-ribosyltransferase